MIFRGGPVKKITLYIYIIVLIQYLQVGVVLDGVSNILATAEKLAEVDKVTRNILQFH